MTTDSKILAASPGLRAALGHYGLVAEIGRGGMTSVVLALLPNGDGTARPLALKQLRSEFSMQNGFRAMLENEAFLGSRLRHPNIVETYDIYADRDLCVVVMEFLDGQTLAAVRQRAVQQSDVPFAIHLRVLADALAGLHYVHELKEGGKSLGIVHRNVTPSNVFVTYEGRAKLIDFGIATATVRDAESRMSGVVKGTLGYMSPEAVRRERLDRRADIFSVGVMLWEAATGRRFWKGHDEIAMFRRLAAGDLPIQASHAEGTSAEMLAIAARALAVDPADRYATADDMRQELEGVLERLGHTTRLATLGDYMQTSFSVEKEKLRTVIDEALAQFASECATQNTRVGTEVSMSYPDADSLSARMTSPLASTGTFRTTSHSYDVVDRGSDANHFRPRLQRALGIACVTAAAIGVAYGARAPARGSDPASAAPLQAAVNAGPLETAVTMGTAKHASAPRSSDRPRGAIADDAPQSGERSARETISAVFVVHPLHARLFLDGLLLEGNPAALRRQPDDKPHLLRAEAPGYATLVHIVELDRDVAKEIELMPQTNPAASASRPASSGDPRNDGPKARPVTAKPPASYDDRWGI